MNLASGFPVRSRCGGEIDRREFLQYLREWTIAFAGGYPLAHFVLESEARAAQFPSPSQTGSAAVAAGPVKYPAGGATLAGYLAKPDSAGQHPAVLLIPANRGLVEHIREVARRYAREGFVTLAVDQLSRQGGSAIFASPDKVTKNIEALPKEEFLADLDAAFAYLQSNPSVRRARVGVTGFGWGGHFAFLYAASNHELKAAVVFYGIAPPAEMLAQVDCPVLGHYGAMDAGMSSEVREIAALMKQQGKSFAPEIYPAAGTGFFNDAGQAYNAAAAEVAWQKTIAFFHKYLG